MDLTVHAALQQFCSEFQSSQQADDFRHQSAAAAGNSTGETEI